MSVPTIPAATPTVTDDASGTARLAPLNPVGRRSFGDEDHETVLVVRAVQQVTHDVKTFVLESEEGHLFHFDPGQFLTLNLRIGERDVLRSYTIASPPTRPHLASLTVKRKPGGLVSNYLHDVVNPGARILAQPPLGAFTIARNPSPKYLFLGAGSGITPLMSMVRSLHDLSSSADVVLLNSVRSDQDVIFGPELRALAAVHPSLHVGILRSDVGVRLKASTLQKHVPDLHERVVFCCGPEGYMAAVRSMLRDAGYPMELYQEESFSFETLSPEELVETVSDPLALAGARATGTYAVTFARSGQTIECSPEENILDAAFRAGISPPSSCSQGMCGTCKTGLLSGDVDMQHKGGIRPREIAAGKVLLCCSKPRGDVTVDA